MVKPKKLSEYSDKSLKAEMARRKLANQRAAKAAEEKKISAQLQKEKEHSIPENTPFYVMVLTDSDEPDVDLIQIFYVTLKFRLYLLTDYCDRYGGREVNQTPLACGKHAQGAYMKDNMHGADYLMYALAGHDITYARVYPNFTAARNAYVEFIDDRIAQLHQRRLDVRRMKKADVLPKTHN